MRRGTWRLVAAACATVLGILTVSHVLSAQDGNATTKKKPPPPPEIYFPYPPGLIPADLESEIQRVNDEIDKIFDEALAEWKALPINSGTQMRQIQLLGKLDLFDKNLSVNRNQACSFCHMPYTG